MRYRQGRHRRRHLYAQVGPRPSDDDVFVALFDDEHMAARVARLLTADEAHQRLVATTSPVFEPAALERACGDSSCGHPLRTHTGPLHTGYCLSPDPSCTCVRWVEPVRRQNLEDVLGPAFDHDVQEPGLNPFCQWDGCTHERHEHEHPWGIGTCRHVNCFCASFQEAT